MLKLFQLFYNTFFSNDHFFSGAYVPSYFLVIFENYLFPFLWLSCNYILCFGAVYGFFKYTASLLIRSDFQSRSDLFQ